MDLGALDRFLQRHRRDDGGDAFRQHRLSGTGRSDHKQVMSARDCHLDRALHMALSLHVTEIDVVTLMGLEKGAQVTKGRLHCDLAPVELESLPKISNTVDVDAFH